MSLTAGKTIGPYEIAALIGEGGMGEVYRATDRNLKRPVAIKVLPEAVATDGERLARFQREAEVLAKLNHPNIAQIHGLEKSDGTTALVMELVEGPTLADRIGQGPIALDEALSIAKQIAEALEAAHERGIVHRDLKPANIKVRHDGTVKVLDFGLAKALEPISWQAVDATASPTITSPAMMTGVGMLLGTAAYMSPEQAKGRPVTKACDIWAFGCVLYEMLAGKRAFEGDDVSDTLAAVLRAEPNWSALPNDLPTAVRVLVERCLEKDWRKRAGDVAVARFALEEVSRLSTGRGTPSTAAWRAGRIRRVAALTAAVLTGAGLAYSLVMLTARDAALPRVARLTIRIPEDTSPALSGPGVRSVSISPDGSRVAYVGGIDARLFIRPLNQFDPTPLTSVADAAARSAAAAGGPGGFYRVGFGTFFSPDGAWVAFSDRGVLKRAAVTGGAAISIGPAPLDALSGTWSENGTIVVAGNPVSDAGLWKFSAAGGDPVPLTKPDAAHGEVAHLWPSFLPGGDALLFTVFTKDRTEQNAQIALLNLATGVMKLLIQGASSAKYVGGYILYGRAGTLEAVPFDTGRQEVVGIPTPIATGVWTRPNTGYVFDVSRDGTLVYFVNEGLVRQRRLVWVDRSGREEPINAPPLGYTTLRLSPDETRVALDINDGRKRDIFVWDFERENLQRITNDSQTNNVPVWLDNRRIVYSAGPAGKANLFLQPADGSRPAERVTESPNGQYSSAVLPDGRVVFREEIGNDRDLMIVAISGDRQPLPLVKTRFAELNGEVSPDGKRLAYQANDTGHFEIYVRPFPNVADERQQVSTGGGTKPVWSRNGRELFYFAADALMSVPVIPGNTWKVGKPSRIVAGYVGEGEGGARGFDVSADGKRFLMIKEDSSNESRADSSRLEVVMNVTEELRTRLLPRK